MRNYAKSIIFLVSTLALLLSCCSVSLAADAAADKAELRARFEKRLPQVLQYKHDGKIGETTKGLIEAVDPKNADDDSKLAQLIDDENTDRRALYKLIAAEEGTTTEKVAEQAARRNYDRAKPGEYLKTADGKWKRKS